MKTWMTLVFMLLCMNVAAFGAVQNVELAARTFVLFLHQEEFNKAVELFDATARKAVTPDKLRALWNGQQQAVGVFQDICRTRTEDLGAYRAVFVTCRFEKKQIDVKVIYDKAVNIAGFFFAPTRRAEYQVPEYVDEKAFNEAEVQVGTGEWALPGTLTIPANKGPFPAVILVHGSGAQDRDETIGPNKPFRDLAWGLASKGIAVLRYEKRTRHYATKFSNTSDNLTVQEETMTDAMEAVSLLKRNKVVKADCIFMLGHSLGGMLIPRIGKNNESSIAGFVIMAGNTRPLEDLILEQTLYQASLTTALTPEAEHHIEEVKHQVAAIKGFSNTDLSRVRILGAPPSYWLDLKGYRPTEAAKAVQRPMLILQGEKDCQVSSEKDFKEWHHALLDRKNVQFELYPTLNHLFMEADAKSTGAEYQQPGNVAAIVVRDIADWIMKHEN